VAVQNGSNAINPPLNCTQCGGELHPNEGENFLVCPYCSATVYVDKARVVFHWYVAPTLNEIQAKSALYQWMSGNQTVKDLDKKSQLGGHKFEYFPLWHFIWTDGNNEQQTGLQPAAATSIPELANLHIPAGDLRKYEMNLDPQSEPPSVPLESAVAWFSQNHGLVEVREMALVHVPIYIFKYAYRGQAYTAVVEAASGQVLASLYPVKAEMPYLLLGCVTAIIFLCLSFFPVIGATGWGGVGSATGLALCIGLGIVAVPFLMIWGLWVANKV
jgi:hypothetical protein